MGYSNYGRRLLSTECLARMLRIDFVQRCPTSLVMRHQTCQSRLIANSRSSGLPKENCPTSRLTLIVHETRLGNGCTGQPGDDIESKFRPHGRD
jgi:hypothetical protein